LIERYYFDHPTSRTENYKSLFTIVITQHSIHQYLDLLHCTLQDYDWTPVEQLATDLLAAWQSGAGVWICGNGGSAANANHWANDFLYPVAKHAPKGLRIQSLSANPAVLSCLGNDLGYENIYSYQLHSMGRPGDLLIVLSGSGNSPNILGALKKAREVGIRSYAIIGFDGGKAKALADVPIHFPVDDMQVAEDTQMIICHFLTKEMRAKGQEIRP
jgi:D-sedoheptulose 7-phosphate isomerase